MKKIFSVFDKKSGKYGFPMLYDDQTAAVRSFDLIVNNKQESLISRYPEDFCLHYLAEFDVITGQFANNVVPTLVIEALELKKS